MKINETKPSHIDEGPLDLLTRSGRERNRAFKQGKQVSATAIRQLTNQFASYLGSQGKRNFRQAETQDVIDFLNSKGVDTSDIDTAQPMNQKRLDNIFKTKVQQTMSLRNQPKPTSSAPSASGNDSAKASSAYTQTKTSAMKLSAKEKRRLADQLLRSIKKPTAPPFKSRRTGTSPSA